MGLWIRVYVRCVLCFGGHVEFGWCLALKYVLCAIPRKNVSAHIPKYNSQICLKAALYLHAQTRTITTVRSMESIKIRVFGRNSVRGLSLHFSCTNLFVAIPRTATNTVRRPYPHRGPPSIVIESISVWRAYIHSIHIAFETCRCTSTIEPKNMSEINKMRHTILVCQFNIKYCLCIFLNEAHLLHIIHIRVHVLCNNVVWYE